MIWNALLLAAVANTPSSGPTEADIKRIVQQDWSEKNSASRLTGPVSQLETITKSTCQQMWGWGDAKTPFHYVYRCNFTVSYKTPEGVQEKFDDMGLYEKVDGNWRKEKGPPPPMIAPPTSPNQSTKTAQ